MQNGTYKKLLVYLTHAQVDAWNFKPKHKGLLESRLSGTTVQICENSKEFKDNLPSMSENSISEEKYLDEYSKDDLQKLNDILKSVEKK